MESYEGNVEMTGHLAEMYVFHTKSMLPVSNYWGGGGGGGILALC